MFRSESDVDVTIHSDEESDAESLIEDYHTVYRKIGRIRNGEYLEIRKGRGRPQKFSATQKRQLRKLL